MHDIKAIRENPAAFDAALARRGDAPMSGAILKLDSARREKIGAAEAAQAEQNKASKLVGAAKAKGDEAEFERLRALVGEKKEEVAAMQAEAETVVKPGAPGQTLAHRRVAFMRYHGQGHEIEIALPDRALNDADIAELTLAFEAEYSRQFSRVVPSMTIEILNWALSVSTQGVDVQPVDVEHKKRVVMPNDHCEILCDVKGDWRQAGLFVRGDLSAGDQITGPALIVEPQTTTLVSADFDAQIDEHGNIWLTRQEEGAP